MEQAGVKKGGLNQALSEALSKTTEQERIIAVLDCVRGYRNEYNRDLEEEKDKFEGFNKCKSEYRNQIEKVKEFVSKHNF